jgi:L-fuculose-phosphate aldolase
MVAVAGGIDIRCAKYATYGTSQLSKNIIIALKQRSACLIENHGQVSFSNNLENAFELAQEVEHLAEQYLECLRVGKPKILPISEMNKVLAKVKNYKQ